MSDELKKDLLEDEEEELDKKKVNQENEDELEEDEKDKDDEEDEKEEEGDDQGDDSDKDEDEEEETKKPSRRESLRIQQLLDKLKDDDTSAPTKSKSSKALKYDDELDADEEVIKKLNDDRENYGNDKYRQGMDEAYRFNSFETRLEVDAPRVEAKYPQLDKGSDQFNPVLAQAINLRYLQMVGFDGKNKSVRTADIRYADFVEAEFELASEIAGVEIEKSTTNIKKQAAKAGLRPGGSSSKRLNLNKAPSEMTDAELDAVISASIPKRR